MREAIRNRLGALAAILLFVQPVVVRAEADAAVPRSALPQSLDRGAVVLSFDDRNFDDWLKALPLMAKYGARATFFVSGNIDGQTLDAVRQLHSHGHAIGAHGIHHLRAVEYSQQRSVDEYLQNEVLPQVEQLKVAGITPTAFAYPNSRNNEATDAALLKVFRHLRTGCSVAAGEQVSGKHALFVPADQVSSRGCLCGKGIDFAPERADRTYEQIDGALTRAAQNREVLVLYAHGIASSGKGNHITPEALERVLWKTKELGLAFYTFDQLP